MKSITILFLVFAINIFSQNSDWMYRNPNPQNDFYSVKFFNYNTGYVAGGGGVMLKTTNAGASFQALKTGTAVTLYDMYFITQQAGFVFGDNSTIIYTSNGGTSWLSVMNTTNAPAIKSVKFTNPLTGFGVGTSGYIIKTTNGGFNWTVMPQITQLNLNTVIFQNENTGWIAADSGRIFKTSNGGNSWSMQTVGSVDLYGIAFINSLTGYVTTRFSGGFKTNDGGNSWNNAQVGYSGEGNRIKFASASTGYVYGKNGPISRTTNGGLSWYAWSSYELFSGNTYYDISIVDSTTSYVCGAKGWILKCYGYLQNQSAAHIGGSKSSLSKISFTSASTGAMMGDGSLLFSTTNGGDNWNISFCGNNSWFEGTTWLTGLWLYSPTSWYVSTYSPGIGGFPYVSVRHSTDGGLTWAGPRTFGTIGYGISDIFEAGGVSYITLNSQVQKNSGSGWTTVYTGSSTGSIYFTDANTGFVSLYSSGLKSILYTSNGGTNWITYSTGSTKYIESVYLRPSGLGFAGCDSALLLRTTNFGMNWSQIPVPNNLHVQNIRFANENTGWFMGTDHTYPGIGRLFVTNNGGTSFQQMLSLGNLDVKGYSFIDPMNGYICGDSGMVLKTTNGGITFINQNSGMLPESFSLSQNYPNPFNPVTNIKFDLPKSGFVKMTIYDLLGREITTLVNQQMQAGSYSADWDASAYPSGVYFYKIEAGDFIETRKMVLVK